MEILIIVSRVKGNKIQKIMNSLFNLSMPLPHLWWMGKPWYPHNVTVRIKHVHIHRAFSITRRVLATLNILISLWRFTTGKCVTFIKFYFLLPLDLLTNKMKILGSRRSQIKNHYNSMYIPGGQVLKLHWLSYPCSM